MKLADLSKSQWDAAREAARCLTRCNPDRADDRAAFRAAKARLAELLPADTDVRDLITQAVRWDMLNGIAEVIAGIPGATISTGEPASAQ